MAAVALLPARRALAGKDKFKVGILGPVRDASDKNLEAFLAALREHGLVEGRNLLVEYREVPALSIESARHTFVNDLIAQRVDVIVASATRNALAARQATSQIPIVMVNAGDPVEIGLATSLDRPGGNVTGLSRNATELAQRDLELLLELIPGCKRIGILANPSNPLHAKLIVNLRRHAKLRGVTHHVGQANKASDLPKLMVGMQREKVSGMLVLLDGVFYQNRKELADLALAHKLPAIYQGSQFVDAGGLMSYAPDTVESYRAAAGYVVKILKGARPSDLPIEAPPRLEMAVNLKTAKALGITIPPVVMKRVDKVVE